MFWHVSDCKLRPAVVVVLWERNKRLWFLKACTEPIHVLPQGAYILSTCQVAAGSDRCADHLGANTSGIFVVSPSPLVPAKPCKVPRHPSSTAIWEIFPPSDERSRSMPPDMLPGTVPEIGRDDPHVSPSAAADCLTRRGRAFTSKAKPARLTLSSSYPPSAHKLVIIPTLRPAERAVRRLPGATLGGHAQMHIGFQVCRKHGKTSC